MRQIALGEGESIIFKSRLHWMFFGSIVWRVMLVFVLYGGLYQQAPGLFKWLPFQLLSAVIAICMAGIVLLHVIDYSCAQFVLTDKRLILKQGWWQRSTLDIRLSRIESLQVVQSLVGRWFGYGMLVVHGVGGSRDPLSFLPQPISFRNRVQVQIDQ